MKKKSKIGYIVLIGLVVILLTLFFCDMINNDPFYSGNAKVGGGPNDDPGPGPYRPDLGNQKINIVPPLTEENNPELTMLIFTSPTQIQEISWEKQQL